MKKKRILRIIISFISVLVICLAICYTVHSQEYKKCCRTSGRYSQLIQDPVHCGFNQLGIPNMAWYCHYVYFDGCDSQFVFTKCYSQGSLPPPCINPPCGR